MGEDYRNTKKLDICLFDLFFLTFFCFFNLEFTFFSTDFCDRVCMKFLSSFFLSGMHSPSLSCATSCESWTRRRTSSGRRWFAAMRCTDRDCRRRWGRSEELLKASTTLDYCPLMEGRTFFFFLWRQNKTVNFDGERDVNIKGERIQHLEEGMISDDKRRERWDRWGNKGINGRRPDGRCSAVGLLTPKIQSNVPYSFIHPLTPFIIPLFFFFSYSVPLSHHLCRWSEFPFF